MPTKYPSRLIVGSAEFGPLRFRPTEIYDPSCDECYSGYPAFGFRIQRGAKVDERSVYHFIQLGASECAQLPALLTDILNTAVCAR